MKALIVIFSILLVLLLSRLWVGMGSYPERWRTEEKTTILKIENEKRQEEISIIQAELDDAKSGDDAVEERARSELGMTKKGETFFEIILQPKKEISLPEKLKKSVREAPQKSQEKNQTPTSNN